MRAGNKSFRVVQLLDEIIEELKRIKLKLLVSEDNCLLVGVIDRLIKKVEQEQKEFQKGVANKRFSDMFILIVRFVEILDKWSNTLL